MQPLSGDHQLYCEAWPENGRTPLLLIHGFLSSQAQWSENIEGLAAFSRPVTVELPGHARSASAVDAATLDALLAQFELIRTALGVEQWWVCGHSLGGALALNYALEYPDAVSKVIFTNSRSAIETPENAPSSGPVNALIDHLRKNGAATIKAMPFHPSKMKHVSDTLKAALIADADLHGSDGLIAMFEGALGQVNVRDRITSIQPPVLLVNGSYESSFQDVRGWIETALPSIQIADFEAGHSPNAERPVQFNATLESFLGQS